MPLSLSQQDPQLWSQEQDSGGELDHRPRHLRSLRSRQRADAGLGPDQMPRCFPSTLFPLHNNTERLFLNRAEAESEQNQARVIKIRMSADTCGPAGVDMAPSPRRFALINRNDQKQREWTICWSDTWADSVMTDWCQDGNEKIHRGQVLLWNLFECIEYCRHSSCYYMCIIREGHINTVVLLYKCIVVDSISSYRQGLCQELWEPMDWHCPPNP